MTNRTPLILLNGAVRRLPSGDAISGELIDIENLTAAASFASGDKLVIWKAGVGNRQIDFDDLPTVGGSWGSITGTLSNQTDLQAALDLKATKAYARRMAIALG